MQKIHETLYILHKCNINLNITYEAMSKHKQTVLIGRNHFTLNLAYYAIMECNTFIDEYHKYFNTYDDVELSDRIKRTKKFCKPILKRLNSWSGIKSFRNEIIAHGWRSANSFIVPQNPVYKIPRTFLEMQFLRDLISYIYGFIRLEFDNELNEALFYAEQMRQEVEPVYKDIESINNEVDKMVIEIRTLERDCGKDYDLALIKYYPPAP